MAGRQVGEGGIPGASSSTLPTLPFPTVQEAPSSVGGTPLSHIPPLLPPSLPGRGKRRGGGEGGEEEDHLPLGLIELRAQDNGEEERATGSPLANGRRTVAVGGQERPLSDFRTFSMGTYLGRWVGRVGRTLAARQARTTAAANTATAAIAATDDAACRQRRPPES